MENTVWYKEIIQTINSSKQLRVRNCYSIATRENAANLTLEEISNGFKTNFYSLLFQSIKQLQLPLEVIVLDDVDPVILNGLATVLKPEISVDLAEFHMSELDTLTQLRLQRVLESLSLFPKLQVITFPSKLKSDCCETLSNFFKTCSPKLDYVELCGRLNGSLKRESGIDLVVEGMSRMELLHLKVSNMSIGLDEGVSLSKFISTQCWLRHLDLSKVNMGDECVKKSIIPLIKHNILEELYLHGNCLTGESLPIISELVALNKLKVLDISQNAFNGQNFDTISKAVGTCYTIEAFYIGNRHLVKLIPGALENLGQFLKSNKSLDKIGIYGFPKVTPIIKDLRHSTTLNSCSFGSLLQLDESDELLLLETLKWNPSLKEVLFRNDIEDIQLALAQNQTRKDSFHFLRVVRMLQLFPLILDIKLSILELLTDFVPLDLHVIGKVLFDTTTVFPTWLFLQDKSHFIRICHYIYRSKFNNSR